MLKLEKFKESDAEIVAGWIKDKNTFDMWSAGKMGEYPLSSSTLIGIYKKFFESGNFFAFSAIDQNKVVGHITMRYLNNQKNIVRLGFVIVDDSLRGQGYGNKMMNLAIDYAFNVLNAKRVTVAVFKNNFSAKKCYKTVGFELTEEREYYIINGVECECEVLEINRKS
jgi:RimJ/RimL family protein N-acetyltransferase